MQAAIQTQIDVTKGLYRSFNTVSSRLNSINDSFNNQIGLLTQLTESLNKSNENFSRINIRLESLSEKLETDLPHNINNDIKKETKKLDRRGKKLEKEMKSFAKSMGFEKAALIRDQIHDIRIITKKVE